MTDTNALPLFERVGGEPYFTELVAHFYRGVAADPVLRPMYPEDDLGPAEERFRLFLIQYWGGPTTYSETRGHPRLRMRHGPFAVTPTARDAWLRHMTEAVEASTATPAERDELHAYFAMAAQHMINADG